MTGLRPWMYWASAFAWDALFFVIPSFLILMSFLAFHIDAYTDRAQTLFILGLVFLLFGWAAIPLVYSLQFMFRSSPKGYMVITIINIIGGMIGSITVAILTQTSTDSVAHTLELIFAFIFPTYNLSNCFRRVYNSEVGRIACKSVNCDNPLIKATVSVCCGTEKGRLAQRWISLPHFRTSLC